MKEILEKAIQKALVELGVPETRFVVEWPADMSHGDYATNVALSASKALRKNPREVAELLVASFRTQNIPDVSVISIAGPGFINFKLTDSYFGKVVGDILKEGSSYGHGNVRGGKHVLIEYTDPNPFKPLHIGHLMSNTIGEALSRLIEAEGAKITRACYQGDVGLHVAKALWGMMKDKSGMPDESAPLAKKSEWLGYAYVAGATAYEEDEQAKKEIVALNKKVFEMTDAELRALYDIGRRWSLEHFEEAYATLGTKFDRYFFERDVAPDGVALVSAGQKTGVFEESDGAVVYRGEQDGLHTRVFITREGLPTYETKELGLTKKKFEMVNPDLSIVVTASEQSDYFKVVLAVMKKIMPEAREKTAHVAHGMMRFASGKMSSRKGNVITAEVLLAETQEAIYAKLAEREYGEPEKRAIARDVGVAALKYSILRQAPGGDIVYDFEKSISLEGDSGPYLQYATVRAGSILAKATEANIVARPLLSEGVSITAVERLLSRFPDVVARSASEFAPNHLATYLIELSGAFNSYYATVKIVDAQSEASPYRVALTQAVKTVLSNGLSLLGMRVPERM
jgi:arginyl-tRNA synthetase